MKEDYHPSLNFAEIAERSLNFLTKNVISENEIKEHSSVLGALSRIENYVDGVNWYVTMMIVLFFFSLIFITSLQPDDHTRKIAAKIKEFNLKYGFKIEDMDPFSDNLSVVYIYKCLSVLFSTIQHVWSPKLNGEFLHHVDYEENSFLYAIILKGGALFLSVIMISIPTILIIEKTYKKNSNIFKALLTILCLTSCGLYNMVGVTIDYQAILYVGWILWTNAMLISDNIIGALVFYGFSLSASLDGLVFLPWIVYRVCCKNLKTVARDADDYNRDMREVNPMYQSNILNIGGVNSVL